MSNELVPTEQLDDPNGSALVQQMAFRYIQEWLVFIERTKNPDTLSTYSGSLNSVYLRWALPRGINLINVTKNELSEYKGWLSEQYKPNSVKTHMAIVSSFYGWLVDEAVLNRNPAKGITAVRVGQWHAREPLTDEEVMALLATCDDSLIGRRDHTILTLMVYCALRIVEVSRSNISHLRNRNDRMVLDVVGKGRDDADEFVVLPIPVEVSIESWLKVHPLRKSTGDVPMFVSLGSHFANRLTRDGISHTLSKRFRAAGIDTKGGRKSIHALRMTAITKASMAGASPIQVQFLGRHKSFDTTLRYIAPLDRISKPAEDLIVYNTEKDDV